MEAHDSDFLTTGHANMAACPQLCVRAPFIHGIDVFPLLIVLSREHSWAWASFVRITTLFPNWRPLAKRPKDETPASEAGSTICIAIGSSRYLAPRAVRRTQMVPSLALFLASAVSI